MGKKLTIDLGDVKLTDSEHAALVSAVHAAVVTQLAKSGNAAAHSATKHLHGMGMGLVAPTEPAPKPAPKKKA